jgi:hypothetical protein
MSPIRQFGPSDVVDSGLTGHPEQSTLSPSHRSRGASFCAHATSKTVALGSIGRGSGLRVLVSRINTIANDRTQYENDTLQLLTEGLLVRI